MLRLLPEKAVFWITIFIIGIVFFAIFRFLFLLTHIDMWKFSEFKEVIWAFWVGFRFDSVILSMIVLPLYLITLLPAVILANRRVSRTLTLILVFIFVIIFFLSAADLKYFDHFGSRLNYWALEYIEYPGLFFYSMVTFSSFALLLIIWIVATVSFYIVLRKAFKRLTRFESEPTTVSKTITYVLIFLLLLIGIRGRFGIKSLDWGTAFFCNNQYINQLALNPVFTLSHSIYEEIRDGRGLFDQAADKLAFFDIHMADRTVARMLGIDSTEISNRFTPVRKSNPHISRDYMPNLVIIIFESWSADRIGALGAEFDATPEFDRLCRDGILFENFYANGIRTNRGIPAILCSFPSLPGRSIMRRYAANYPFHSVAQILDQYGYRSIFAYGGDIEFDNMRGFLKSVGYDKFYGENDFPPGKKLSKWGLPDHLVFEHLINEIERLPRPFNLTILTLSYHEPYLIPDERFEKFGDSIPDANQLNCLYYSDWALGQFMKKFKNLAVYDSTIFVMTSDHCLHQMASYPIDPNRFRIPLLIIAPDIDYPESPVIPMTGGQVDILPTLLGVMGIETSHLSWGRDLLSLNANDSGFAVLVNGQRLGYIAGSHFYFHWIDRIDSYYNLKDTSYLENNLIDSLPESAAALRAKLLSYIQTADRLSRRKMESDDF